MQAGPSGLRPFELSIANQQKRVVSHCSENRGAGVSPAVAGASRSRARAGCPCHSGRDARATSVHRRAIFMVSGCPFADGHERLP
jgi:hypothetical protein